MKARWILSLVPCVVLAIGCGGGQKTVESPASSEPEPSTDEVDTAGEEEAAAEEPDDDAAVADKSDDTEEEAAPAAEEPTKTSGPPAAEVLTTADVAFTFDYGASAMKEAHQKQCEPSSKGDPGALNSCMQNLRQKFSCDVLWFRKEPNGEMVWLVYKRTGNQLAEVFRSTFLFEDEKHESVTMKLVGQGKGYQQIFAGYRTIPISVPTKYAVVIEDPKYGTLKYNSKVGLVAAQNQ